MVRAVGRKHPRASIGQTHPSLNVSRHSALNRRLRFDLGPRFSDLRFYAGRPSRLQIFDLKGRPPPRLQQQRRSPLASCLHTDDEAGLELVLSWCPRFFGSHLGPTYGSEKFSRVDFKNRGLRPMPPPRFTEPHARHRERGTQDSFWYPMTRDDRDCAL
jgi:hypothetical protein